MEEESKMHPHPPPETELGVVGTTRVIRFMSDVVELYLPRVFDMFVALFGGTPETAENQALPRPTSESDTDESQDEGANQS